MKGNRFAFLVGGALALSMVAAGAQAQDAVPEAAAEGGRLWFVEFSGAPVADGGDRAQISLQKASFQRAAAAAGITYVERRSFDVLFNGYSIEVNPKDRLKLARLPGVKAMYPVERIAAPSPEQAAGSAPDLAAAITMTGAKIAQDTLGLSGAGVKVGIIDTGIDIDHPAFGGNGAPGSTAFPTGRIVAGHDFVGDAYDANTNPVAIPDPNPDDCNGHGSHVAGIVGGNGGGIRGVAPGVTFGAYRVFGCNGSTDSDIIVAAMEMALADGMHVVNQSLGSGRQWPQYPTAQAASRLVDKGVVMVTSIGNNGPLGSSPDALYAAGAPGTGGSVIGVASFDNGQRSFVVNGVPYGYNPATGSPLPPQSGGATMARTGTATTTNDACAALAPGSLAGRITLIRRGTCSFYIKAANAQAAGAAAVVLYNNQAGALNATVAGTPAITIPVVGITAAQGGTLDGLIAAGTTTLTWDDDYVAYPYGTGGLISGFSSFGLAADLSFKPNIGAPGGGIYSSYPLELGGATTLSGTSMSSPHVAGGVALILQARPALTAATMRARLENSADPRNWSGNPGLGLLDHAFRQGAGMLDIIGTIESTTLVQPEHIAVGESQAGPKTVRITVTNEAATPVTYDIGHVAGVASGPNTQSGASYNITGVFDAPATVTLKVDSVTAPAGGSGSFNVMIDANPALPDRSLYGGYITLTPRGGGPVYRVPYAGFKGDYQSTVVLTPTANGFPWLAQLVGPNFVNRPAGATYTMQGNDVPQILVHLDHPSRKFRLEAFDVGSGASREIVTDDEFMTRNSTPGGFFAFPWDANAIVGSGKTQKYAVPNGKYYITLSVLKALGDESNPAHWEKWTSPTITIARP